MGVDYYMLLKVHRTCTEEDLKKAYKKLAMRWHPDKNSSPGAEAKFKQISQAYDVLTDPVRRQIYDVYGEDALNFGGAEEEVVVAGAKEKEKAAVVEQVLTCTLEELWNGSRRKMRISRTVPDYSGQAKVVEEILKIDIKPGWKKGTRITFPGKGNEEKGMAPGDLIFVIDEKPHDIFKRDGNDLLVNKRISLLEALTGKTLDLTTLDGRKLNLPITNVINPGYEVVLPNEGMPISKEPGKKGKLRVKFDVKFPSRLSEDQKLALKKVLGGERSVNVSPVRTRIEAYY